MKNFQATTVDLSGYNLIEASAGTGKTYSIAILILRLILEQKKPINTILVVTFTKAAVAELQLRIRKFLYDAYAVTKGDPTIDPTVISMVENAITASDRDAIAQLLYDNITLLDESKIMTIHGFCQSILTENAFESNQIIGAKLVADIDDIVVQNINDFWRSKITVLPIDILSQIDIQLLRTEIISLVKNELSSVPYRTPHMAFDKWDAIIHAFNQSEIDAVDFHEQLLYSAAKHIVQRIHLYKKEKGILTYNDLIDQVYQALQSSNAAHLIQTIREQYSIVFIDEFQDTDHKQYFIFKSIFRTETHTTFMIGDPKQSIYAFRQADIYTYFKARKDAGELVYTMNTNYRSTPKIINAINLLLLPKPDFDTFYFKDDADAIAYHPVLSGVKNERQLIINHEPCDAITIRKIKAADDRIVQIANDVAALVNNPAHYFSKDTAQTPIKPSDIGILVRKNKTGLAIQQQLSRRGIPAVLVNDNTIFGTRTAKGYLALLEACVLPKKQTINQFLVSSLTPYDVDTVLKLSEEATLQLFAQWKKIWDDKGLHSLINQYLSDFGILDQVKQDQSNQTVRTYVDIMQLTEILHKLQLQKNLNKEDIIYHLKQGIAGKLPKDDAHQIRIESDEDAVQITTIHKSKGLEYPIVMLADVDAERKMKNDIETVYDLDKGVYFSITKRDYDTYAESIDTEAERTARRLLYVAFTRAKYKIFTYSKTVGNKTMPKKGGGIFLKHLLQQKQLPEYIVSEDTTLMAATHQQQVNVVKPIAPFKVLPTNTLQQNWAVMSYTRLSGSHYASPKLNLGTDLSAYDTFIFEKIGKGAQFGTKMHSMLERIQFDEDKLWDRIIVRSFNNVALPNDTTANTNAIPISFYQMFLQHLTQAKISTDNDIIQLKKINRNAILHELEFYFPLEHTQSELIAQYLDAFEIGHISDHIYDTIVGYMNGLIDMVFEYNDRFYILDWKTNYLGNRLEDYTTTAIAEAMLEQNYHLQYMIYTLALVKYLRLRKPDFDYDRDFGGVIYLFIRGVRKDNSNNEGVFFTKPSAEQFELFEKIMS